MSNPVKNSLNNMSNYTPGPWTLNETLDTLCVDTPEKRIAWISFWADLTYRSKLPEKEQVANGRLIAAAPELLEALKNLLPICDNDGPLSRVYQKEAIAAEKAIAKAEGQ